MGAMGTTGMMGKSWIPLLIFIIGGIFNVAAYAQEEVDLSWLTAKERRWLKRHQRITVAPTPDYPPFEYWNKDGKFQGVVRSYLDHFTETLDIEFNEIQTKTWEENLSRLESREIDAVSLLVRWSDRDYVKVSDAYIEYPAVIIVRSDNKQDLSLRDLVGKRVAVPNDYTGESYLREYHPQIEVVESKGPLAGVRMVANGDVDAFFGGASVVAYMAEKEGLTNLRIAGGSDFTYSNGFGVRSDWGIFADIISKTLKRMTPAQHREMRSQWVTNDFFRRQYYESTEFWWIAGSALSLLLLGTGLVLVWNRKQAKFIDQLERAKKKAELANLQLEKARQEAEQANETKSSFVANISHEIRTPMNGVLGMCELLRTTQLDGSQQEYLKLATKSAKNLLSLINDILDFSKIEAGKLELEMQPFSLSKLLDEVIGLMKIQAQEKDIALIDDRGKGLATVYEGDALRIRQIMLNLISNAIKFTNEGQVRVHVFRTDLETKNVDLEKPGALDQSSQLHMICFEVSDTGAGVPKDKIEKLFEPFEQEDASITRKHGGTGLGLAICKNLAELMGGSAFADSELGKGSTFSFTAAIKPDYGSVVESIESEFTRTIRPRRILLAEDGVVNQKVAIGLLQKRGHSVDLAENGLEALAALEKNQYDVVLMDIQMPEMDGLTAVRQIRKLESGSGRRQRVIALTAHAMAGDHERFLEAGMDDHLPKPFKPDDLYAAVEQELDATEMTDKNVNDTEATLPVLDRQVALETTGGDEDLAKILLDTCIEEAPKMLAEAKTAISERRFADARRVGHSLKSSFAAIGATAASAKSKELEFTEPDEVAPFESAIQAIELAYQAINQQATS